MALPAHLEKHKFSKGVSANPGGRPKGVAAMVKDLVGNNGEKCLQMLYDIMMGNVSGMKGAQRLDATKELLARGFGRPIDIQAHVMAGDSDVADEVKQLASDALMKLAASVAPKVLPASQTTIDLEVSDTPMAQGLEHAQKDESP